LPIRFIFLCSYFAFWVFKMGVKNFRHFTIVCFYRAALSFGASRLFIFYREALSKSTSALYYLQRTSFDLKIANNAVRRRSFHFVQDEQYS